MTDRVENNTGNDHEQELNQLKQDVQNKTEAQIKENLRNVEAAKAEVKNKIKVELAKNNIIDTFEGDKKDKSTMKGRADGVKKAVQEVLIAAQLPDKISPAERQGLEQVKKGLTSELLKKISEYVRVGDVNEQNAPYLYELIKPVLMGEINSIDGLSSKFKELDDLKISSPFIHANIQKALVESAVSQGGYSETQAKQMFGIQKVEDVHKNTELNNNSDPDDKEEKYDQEYMALCDRYVKNEEKELLKALFKPERLGGYIQNEYAKFKTTHPDITSKEERDKDFSEHFKETLELFVGKIYQLVDEASPSVFAEEAENIGGFQRNPAVAKSRLSMQLNKLRNLAADRNFKITSKEGEEINWYHGERISYDADLPLKTERKVNGEQPSAPRLMVEPFTEMVKCSSFSEYLRLMENHVNHEIEMRKIMHNVRALPYSPTGKDGYWAVLKGYLEKNLKGVDLDNFLRMADSEQIENASRIVDKSMELDNAHYDYIHQPTSGQIEEGHELSKKDLEVLKYLKEIYGDAIPDDRLRRALVIGLADNYSVSLKAIEHGALADPPKIDGKNKAFASYSRKDAAMYRVFNQLAHENLRFSSESLLMGNLLFLKIEGKDLGKSFWNHRDLLDEAKKSINEYVDGKSIEDDKNGTLRFVNMINPASVGGIYSRAGWRQYFTYEALLVPPGGKAGKNLNVLKSWKAVENIGVEVMKNFCTEGDLLGADEFYTKGKASERRELTSYLCKKYFKMEDQKEIDKKISLLEKARDLKGEYKKFYFQVMTRAIAQRIPTKFLRIERTKDISGRERAWEVVRRASGEKGTSGMDKNDFYNAVKDISFIGEIMLRTETTKTMNKEMKKGKKMYEIDLGTDNNYELTEEKLKKFLKDAGADDNRIKKAVRVYNETHKFIKSAEEGNYLNNFASKYEKGKFPFAIAVEEMERTFVSHRSAGDNMIVRAIGEIDASEKNVADSISKLFETMRATSISGKKDFSELLKLIKTASTQVENMHGRDKAHKLAHHMAAMVISYFKQDSMSKGFFGLLKIGEKHSLAAEFSGRSSTVWEWDSRDIDRFCVALETERILPRSSYEVQNGIAFEPLKVKIPILNKEITIPFLPQVKKAWGEWDIWSLRKQFGGDYFHIFTDMIGQFLPIVLILLLWKYITSAMDEAFGKKK